MRGPVLRSRAATSGSVLARATDVVAHCRAFAGSRCGRRGWISGGQGACLGRGTPARIVSPAPNHSHQRESVRHGTSVYWNGGLAGVWPRCCRRGRKWSCIDGCSFDDCRCPWDQTEAGTCRGSPVGQRATIAGVMHGVAVWSLTLCFSVPSPGIDRLLCAGDSSRELNSLRSTGGRGLL